MRTPTVVLRDAAILLVALVILGHVPLATAQSHQSTPAGGHYQGQLVLVPSADGRHMTLLHKYEYDDSEGTAWPVPAGTMVDGASIPQVFWSVIGGPFEGKYRNASVIHDWYCDVRTRPWHDVDRMFYEAMLASGVDRTEAKVMYLAVVYGGPRWDEQTIHNSRLLVNLSPPSKKVPRREYLDAADFDPTRSPVRLNPPDVKARFKDLAKQVREGDLSLDQIDHLAETDPENTRVIVRSMTH